MRKKLTLIVLAMGLLYGCATVKEYEKVNLNDPDMALSTRKSDRYENTFHSYREAASGANGGKTGGGCGCN